MRGGKARCGGHALHDLPVVPSPAAEPPGRNPTAAPVGMGRYSVMGGFARLLRRGHDDAGMGSYRFALALTVVCYHAFGPVAGRHTGVAAVICFLLLSGYVMQLLFDKYYLISWRPAAFWLDRALRLFPQYLFYLVVALVLMWGLGARNLFYLPNPDVRAAILAALLLPTGYGMFGLPQVQVLAVSWSLGLEASFYLLFPFLLITPPVLRFGIFVGSVCIFAVALLGVVPSLDFSLRLLPGTLFVFMLGAAMVGPLALPAAVAGVVIGVATMIIATLLPVAGGVFSFDIGVGLALGSVALYLLRYVKSGRIDALLGNLSYGIYLAHMPVLMFTDLMHIDRTFFVPLVSIAAATFSYYGIERPVLAFRHRLRDRRLRAAAAPAAGNTLGSPA